MLPTADMTAADYWTFLQCAFDGPIPQECRQALDALRARERAEKAERAAYEATRRSLEQLYDAAGTIPSDDSELTHDVNVFLASLKAAGFTVAAVEG